MIGQPGLPPVPGSSSGRTVRIVMLVVLGLVVLCGLLGSCLFALEILLPLFTGGQQ